MKRDCIEHSGQTRRIERCCCHLVSPDGHDDGPGAIHLLRPACRVLARFNLLSRNSLVRRNSSGAKARVLLGEESSKYPIAKSEHDAKVAQAWGA